jgi:uncharacterized protein
MSVDRRPPAPSLGFILGFELALGVLAIVLALFFGLKPWLELRATPLDGLVAVLATLPLLMGLLLLDQLPARAWLDELKDFMRRVVVPWFADTPWWGLALVALAAGVCEELLFRGVIQTGLGLWLGTLPGLLLASLLFGLVHYVSRAYFLITCLAGLYLGLIYLWTGNLLVVMLVHFFYDWAALVWYVRRYRGEINGDNETFQA